MNTSISLEEPPRFSSWKTLIERPLKQVAVLLWLVGFWRLAERVLTNQITVEWVVAASVATLVALVLIVQMRWLWLSCVPIVLGLGVVLGAAHQLGDTVGTTSLLCTGYALMLWAVVPTVLAQARVATLSRALGFAGGHGVLGGCALIRSRAFISPVR